MSTKHQRASFKAERGGFTLTVMRNNRVIDSLQTGVIHGNVAAIGLLNMTDKYGKNGDGSEKKRKKFVFWMVCVHKGKMWVAEKFKFMCVNHEELFDQIKAALMQTGPTNHLTPSTSPYGTSYDDISTYRGTCYMVAVQCRRVGVREKSAGVNKRKSVTFYNQNESVDSRKEIEVGDYCTFGEAIPRAPKKAPKQ